MFLTLGYGYLFTIEVVFTVDLAIYFDFVTFKVKFGISQNEI